jgi:hypothetical protein
MKQSWQIYETALAKFMKWAWQNYEMGVANL